MYFLQMHWLAAQESLCALDPSSKALVFHGDTVETLYTDPDVKHVKTYVFDIGIVGGAWILYWQSYDYQMASLTLRDGLPKEEDDATKVPPLRQPWLLEHHNEDHQ